VRFKVAYEDEALFRSRNISAAESFSLEQLAGGSDQAKVAYSSDETKRLR
jgi:hypothetical protein